MKHIDISELFKNKDNYIGSDVTICGWVRTARESSQVAFIELNDGTTLKNLQLVIDKTKVDGSTYKLGMAVGASIKAVGTLIASERNIIEVNTSSIEVLGVCPSDYPLQKKRHTLDYLRTIPHIRVRARYFEAVFAVRSHLAMAIHTYFQNNDYKYIHAPIITGSDCEGAGEMFRITTHPYKTEYKSEEEYYLADFFNKKASLSVSCQLEGEMAAMGLGKIYTFGPTFRAEHSNTARHVAEFWHVEPEICFADLDDLIGVAEEFIKYIIKYVLDTCPEEMQFFNQWVEKGIIDKLTHVVESDFVRITYTEAVEILKKANKEFKYQVEWGADLQSEHERYLTEEYFKKPVFVTDYPFKIKSFYMKQNADGKTVAATDLLVPGVGEIIGGSQREENLDKLLYAMKEKGLDIESYEEYLSTRKYGTVVHSGFGLGFDRMLMYITGVQNIRDVIQFPRAYGLL